MSRTISYENILKDRTLFRKSGTESGGDFNLLDSPGNKYFKIFFYFNNGDCENAMDISKSVGLLAPTWEVSPTPNDSTYYQYNSAWSYLKMNREDERADQLVKFVNLLSNISSQSPWYFSEITGLDSALERKQVIDFKWEEERKKISIKCLPDAYDNRIGTLLDLYRSIVWSWQMKREVLPSNLRKFDMGIFIFNDPIANFSLLYDYFADQNSPSDILETRKNLGDRKSGEKGSGDTLNIFKISPVTDYSSIGESEVDYRSSYKYIEFHNCEIDYNSSKSGLSTLNNKEGVSFEYTIDISFDDCYEHQFNESLFMGFGDMIQWDLISNIEYNYEPEKPNSFIPTIDELLNWYTYHGAYFDNIPNIKYSNPTKQGFLNNAFNQLIGTAKNIGTGVLKKAILGNLYTFSLTRLEDQLKSATQGNIWSTIRNVNEYINDAKQRKENQIPVVNSLFIKPKKILPTVERIGNLAKSQTIANNL